MSIFQTYYASKALKRPVHINVIIPNDPYYGNQTGEFKTLYYLPGYARGEMAILMDGAANTLSQKYNIAIVSINGENNFYVDSLLRGEMHGEFAGSELVEFTRKTFPLSAKREDTILAGNSMGGYGALRNGLKYAENFGSILSLSPVVGINRAYLEMGEDEVNPMGQGRGYFEAMFGGRNDPKSSDVDIYHLTDELLASPLSFPKLYLACGTEDGLYSQAEEYSAYLRGKNVAHTFEGGAGAHDWAYWKPHIETGLAAVLK